jgi:hypothetical protein
LLDVVKCKVGQILEVISFDEVWWVVRLSKEPRTIGRQSLSAGFVSSVY